MDRLAVSLAEIVQQTVEDYARVRTWKGVSYALADRERGRFAVLMLPDAERAFKPIIVVAVRILNDTAVIDIDTTDRPLAEALMNAGIPVEKIVRIYAGEPAPTT
jgi:hypothetical protein